MSREVSVAARCLGMSLWLLDVRGSLGVAVRYYLLRIVTEPNKDEKGVSFIFKKSDLVLLGTLTRDYTAQTHGPLNPRKFPMMIQTD